MTSTRGRFIPVESIARLSFLYHINVFPPSSCQSTTSHSPKSCVDFRTAFMDYDDKSRHRREELNTRASNSATDCMRRERPGRPLHVSRL
ncbi:hypothetical protein IG631_04200 [Alternaria alternata]|nr:hypothetical protein IG631_04200 [Alternaria alternata]